MISKGVSLSVGHSNADAYAMKKAGDLGFNRVTHLFSSTSRRAKQGSYVVGGIEECALIDDRFTFELIGDCHHVSRESF
jgi:N-acetylglucosamine-6-phosphate deacetylase